MNDSEFLKVAKEAAIEAGKIVEKHSMQELQFHNKGHFANFATQADLESQEKALEIIKANFPDHNIIAEEGGDVDNGSEYTWAIDPIDGTIPFVSGFPVYSVSVGLLKNNQPFVGVINQVGTKELYWAEKGRGSYLNGEKIRVGRANKLADSLIALDFGHKERNLKIKKYFEPIIDIVRQPFAINASAVVLAYIARGYFDGTCLPAHIWDFAAGSIIVLEAGGKLSSFDGGEIDWSKRDFEMIATNGLIQEELVEAFN